MSNPTTSDGPSKAAPMAPVSRSNRPSIVGPAAPESPYPMKLEGVVTKGFGRGARELGIPTANLPDSSLSPLNDLGMTGIYYGFARVHSSSPSSGSSSTAAPAPAPPPAEVLSTNEIQSLPAETAPYPTSTPEDVQKSASRELSEEDSRVWPMVMSVGWNPFYGNEKITAEVHIIHPFAHDFYGHEMSVLVLGYIRPELDYISKEALIDDINSDVKVALNSLAREGYARYAGDEFLTGVGGGASKQ